MHKLLRLWLATWTRALTFRGDIFLWSLTEVVTPLVSLGIWYTVARTTPGPLTPQETLTYYTLAILTLSMTNVWNGFYLIQEIQNGKIVPFIIRPLGFFWHQIARNLTAKVVRLAFQGAVFGTIFVMFASAFSPTIFEPRNIALFLLSLGGGLAIAFLLDMIFAMFAFWIEDAIQVREFKEVIGALTSGLLIPLALMPPLAQTLFAWLPFRHMISTPLEIILGKAPGSVAWQLLGTQIIWIAIFAVLLRIVWRKGLKAYVVPGQ